MVMVMIEGLLADYDWRINALEPLLMQESLEAATCSSNYNDAAEFDVTWLVLVDPRDPLRDGRPVTWLHISTSIS